MVVKVKICGLTRPDDAALAVALGATHVGCVLAPDSPRTVGVKTVRAVFDAAKGAMCVLVCRRVDVAAVVLAARAAAADAVQLHGYGEDALTEFEHAGLRVIRVYALAPDQGVLPTLAPEPTEERPAVLDLGPGGTGRSFRWEVLRGDAPRATFVAGGVRPENLRFLREHHPWGIDVSSGVESAPGRKDPERLRLLFEEVRSWA